MSAQRRTDLVPAGPPIDVRIVAMRRRHLRGIMRIERQVYPRPWTVGVFTSEMVGHDRRYLVARRGTTVLGYAGMLYSVDDAHVTNVAVDPMLHRQQIGTRLLLALVREAIRAGARNMTLEVRVTNTSAQMLYQRFGFAPAGVRSRYYENTDDAIVMWLHDIDLPVYEVRLAAIEAGVRGRTMVDL